MKPPATTHFFLGANSESGFYSLYNHFCSGPADLLHIIKGGPGTGKSTFMRRIGSAAEERGLDVDYILCSGDPESLDGVYIPALHTGWADGTAPHVLEPRIFGTAGDYTDLGRFCDTALPARCSDLIEALTVSYRRCYQNAYAYLAAAGSLRRRSFATLSPDMERKLRKRARSKIKRELHSDISAPPVKRFISAVSCQGHYFTEQTLNALCERLCVLESHFGLEQLFFEEILRELVREQSNYILCPDPLCPDFIQAIILPNEKLCFIAAHSPLTFTGPVRTIHLDTYLPHGKTNENELRENLIEQLMNAAYFQLRSAKKLHDDLEACYRPALNIDALTDYTDTVISKLFP